MTRPGVPSCFTTGRLGRKEVQSKLGYSGCHFPSRSKNLLGSMFFFSAVAHQ